jgi:hypothetical protein
MDRYDMEIEEPRDFKWLWWAVPIVVVAGLGGALYYGRYYKQQPVAAQVQTEPAAPVAEAEAPAVRNTIEPPAGTAAADPLPPLGASDGEMRNSLEGVFGRSLENFLVPRDIVRHFVATIDNLPRKKNAAQMWPVKPTAGEFAISGSNDELITLNEENYARYEPLMAVLKNTDATEVAALYKRFYPLFQKAYEEQGYPDGYFNDRLVAVIDHLLETPEVQGPIPLNQPKVFYEFADPALEQRSSGQKLLIRMGPGNAALIKLKLRELRREIVTRS